MRPWQALVKAGVAEQLCLGILEYDSFVVSPVPLSPTQSSGKALHIVENTPWYLPVAIIWDALSLTEHSDVPNAETTRVIKALRKYWTGIMERVCPIYSEAPVRSVSDSLLPYCSRYLDLGGNGKGPPFH